MATAVSSALTIDRPAPDADHTERSKWRTAGFVLALVGLMAAMAAFIGNIVAGGRADEAGEAGTVAETLSWTFGLTTTGFAIIKIAIAVVLIGIILRLWMRVDSVKHSLARLKPDTPAGASVPSGDIETEFGKAETSTTAPGPLGIHRMARVMWAPMLFTGGMAVLVGFVFSLVTSSQIESSPDLAVTLSAWAQGTQFLGEGFLLAGISFLLGTILASLREGGGEVQEHVGVVVKTLKMPATAKVFVGLMMIGVMLAMAQFVLYIVVATLTDPQSIAAWFAFLGPLRELSLGVLLAGIVLALVTIGNVLGFQFGRIREIIRTGV